MPGITEGARTARLCHSEALYTGTGRPLETTWYSYDGEGMIAAAVKAYYSPEPAAGEPASRLRSAHQDAYGIVMWEEDMADALHVKSRKVRYEKGKTGLVRRVIVTEEGGLDGKPYQEIYHIGHWMLLPHRRGLITRLQLFTPDLDWAGEYQYHYDKHGQVTRIETREADGSLSLEEKRMLRYDEHGQLIRYNAYHIENRYDPEGFLQEAVYREKDPVTKTWLIAYRRLYTYQDCMLTGPSQLRVKP